MSLTAISSTIVRHQKPLLIKITKEHRKLTKMYHKMMNSLPSPYMSQHVTKNSNSFLNSEFVDKKRAICVRNLHGRIPKTPELIYVPQVGRWLKNKFRFKILKKTWDPEFSEGAFIYGSTRAICRITEIVHQDNPEQLHELLTLSARMKLIDDMKFRLTKVQKSIIRLTPQDIKILVPLNVDFNKQGTKKNCRVTLRILALKWVEQAKSLKLVLVVLQSEFVRDYSPNVSTSEWTISAFDILECGMLAQAPT